MLSNATIGSKVALLNGKKIVGEATIEGQTNCYWHLSNDQRVKKELEYYWESHNKSKRIEVKLWSEDLEVQYLAYAESKRIAAALSLQKTKLSNYVEYMKAGHFSQISSEQIANILTVCQKQIGDISTPRTR